MVTLMAVPEDLVSIDEAAAIAGRHPATVRRWTYDGLLKRYKRRLDRRVYIDREALERLLREPPVEER